MSEHTAYLGEPSVLAKGLPQKLLLEDVERSGGDYRDGPADFGETEELEWG